MLQKSTPDVQFVFGIEDTHGHLRELQFLCSAVATMPADDTAVPADYDGFEETIFPDSLDQIFDIIRDTVDLMVQLVRPEPLDRHVDDRGSRRGIGSAVP